MFQFSVNQTNDENLIEEAHDICYELPDGNAAKPYPLDNVYENIKTPTAMPTISPTRRATWKATELNTRLIGMIFFAMSIFSVCMW